MITASGLYFKTSAETTFRFLIDGYDFEEEHTALNDAIIETEILKRALKKGKIEQGIQYFPFQELGETVDYITRHANKKHLDIQMIENVINTMYEKLQEYDRCSSFASQLETKLLRLEKFLSDNYGTVHENIVADCRKSQLYKRYLRQRNYIKNLKPDGGAWKKVSKELDELEKQLSEMGMEF